MNIGLDAYIDHEWNRVWKSEEAAEAAHEAAVNAAIFDAKRDISDTVQWFENEDWDAVNELLQRALSDRSHPDHKLVYGMVEKAIERCFKCAR